jgi:hypothetical protein
LASGNLPFLDIFLKFFSSPPQLALFVPGGAKTGNP